MLQQCNMLQCYTVTCYIVALLHVSDAEHSFVAGRWDSAALDSVIMRFISTRAHFLSGILWNLLSGLETFDLVLKFRPVFFCPGEGGFISPPTNTSSLSWWKCSPDNWLSLNSIDSFSFLPPAVCWRSIEDERTEIKSSCSSCLLWSKELLPLLLSELLPNFDPLTSAD